MRLIFKKVTMMALVFAFVGIFSKSKAIKNGAELFGFAETQGLRKTMEDAHHCEITQNFAFFGLYDGHGGSDVANFAAQKLHTYLPEIKSITEIPAYLHKAFVQTHHDLGGIGVANPWFGISDQGATALAAFIYKNTLFVANAGDSRAVLCNAGRAIALSIDHKPARLSEKERIEALGGFITFYKDDVPRVNGQLAITRALGDTLLRPYIIPDPEISQRVMQDDDEFLILACDGVWDVLDNQNAVDTVRNSLKKEYHLEKAAQALKDRAFNAGSTDNISVIVVDLKKLRTL